MNICVNVTVTTFTTVAKMVVKAETMTAIYGGHGAIVRAESASGKTIYNFVITPSRVTMKIKIGSELAVDASILPGGWIEAEATPEGEAFIDKINALSR